jgi:hypothetical protein
LFHIKIYLLQKIFGTLGALILGPLAGYILDIPDNDREEPELDIPEFMF